jgi:hypothetical protein
MTTPLTLDESTDRLAGNVAIDEALFAVVGSWSADEPDPGMRVVFATVSRLFGEHSQEARAVLPDSPALRAAERVVVPDDWADRLSALDNASGRSATLVEVVAARSERDAATVDRLTTVADAPVLRLLARTRLDHDHALALLDQR